MYSTRVSSPRVIYPKLAKPNTFTRKSNHFRNSYGSSLTNDDQQITFALEKLELINEIRDIKRDIAAYEQTLRDKEEVYDKQMEKTLKDPYNRVYDDDQKKEVEKFNKNANQVQVPQSNIEELDTQIQFFKTLFSEESLVKIQDEVFGQKQIHNDLLNDIQTITENNELLLCDIEGTGLAEKIQETMDLKSLTQNYQQEIKTLRQEGKDLMEEASELQKNDPIDKNKKQLVLLNNVLQRVQRRRILRERDANEASKRKEVQKTISQDVKNDISQEKKREQKERQKLKEIKENSNFNSHEMMPIDTIKSPRNKKRKEEADEGDTTLFEITQQQNNYVEEEVHEPNEENTYEDDDHYRRRRAEKHPSEDEECDHEHNICIFNDPDHPHHHKRSPSENDENFYDEDYPNPPDGVEYHEHYNDNQNEYDIGSDNENHNDKDSHNSEQSNHNSQNDNDQAPEDPYDNDN